METKSVRRIWRLIYKLLTTFRKMILQSTKLLRRKMKYTVAGAFLLLAVFILLIYSFRNTNKTPYLDKYNITAEERESLKEFFREILFLEPGAFVLYGTKPMTFARLFNYTEEQKIKLENSDHESDEYWWFTRNENNKKLYKEFKRIQERMPTPQYLIESITHTLPFCCWDEGDSAEYEDICFINVELMIRTLINNYGFFRYTLGVDFDPLKVIFEIGDKNSQFWDKVLNISNGIKYDLLLGNLLGFGLENSYLYSIRSPTTDREWIKYQKDKMKKFPDKKEEILKRINEHIEFLKKINNPVYSEEMTRKIDEFINSLPSHATDRFDEEGKLFPNYSVKAFDIPIFGEFGLYSNNSITKRYQKEKKKIEKIYKGRDEVDVAIEWLTRGWDMPKIYRGEWKEREQYMKKYYHLFDK